MTPTIGCIVHVTLDKATATAINQRRKDAAISRLGHEPGEPFRYFWPLRV